MPGAERHSDARNRRACSHRAPKKQAKGDGRAAKGQHDQYVYRERRRGTQAAHARKQALPSSKRGLVGAPEVGGGVPDILQGCLAASGDEAGGGVQATDAKLVDETSGGVQATDAKLRMTCSSVVEMAAVFKPRVPSCDCMAAGSRRTCRAWRG
ncbi:hypothetical protein PF004_g1448 [Phytophthora fragariae]|uniref:Uncharacterized protein n=1 Tax=Phytophthora fragariae TaxID=53985 RepID=A0A6G0PSA5_9STRA|nr:hypothetical protein PF004_g1448 [Phytophthora fragariae]